MKRITVLFLFAFMLLITMSGYASTKDENYIPLKPAFKTLTAGESPLLPDFIKYGTKCWFNEREVMTVGNSAGNALFSWVEFEDGSGSRCLMILVDAEKSRGGANLSLHIPKYGMPVIGRESYNILIDWVNPADPNDEINLVFPIEGEEMWVHKNSLKGKKDSYKVKLPAGASNRAGASDCYYVPLYAILNEVGGGVMFDPFDDGAAFIYTGGALQGYSGVWEVKDDTGYRVDVEMKGVTVSVGNYWRSLELRPDGTFREIDRHYKDEGGWFKTEYSGQYAFFGRILAMKYVSESLYFGEVFNDPEPVKVDPPFEGYWGAPAEVDIYARYVDDWNPADILSIRGDRVLYSKKLSGRKW